MAKIKNCGFSRSSKSEKKNCGKKLVCANCNGSFNDHKAMQSHNRGVHRKLLTARSTVECGSCGSIFPTVAERIIHDAIHSAKSDMSRIANVKLEGGTESGDDY